MNGDSGLLAHPSILTRHRIGLLGVDMELFERCVATEARSLYDAELLVIDEIGIIGGWSAPFRKFVQSALDSRIPVVAIVREKSGEFSDKVKLRSDIELWSVDVNNREAQIHEIVYWVKNLDSPPR